MFMSPLDGGNKVPGYHSGKKCLKFGFCVITTAFYCLYKTLFQVKFTLDSILCMKVILPIVVGEGEVGGAVDPFYYNSLTSGLMR